MPKEGQIQRTEIRPGLARIVVSVGDMQRINLPSLIAGEPQSLGVDPHETVYISGLERPAPPPIFAKPEGLLPSADAVMAQLALRPPDRLMLPPTRILERGMPRCL